MAFKFFLSFLLFSQSLFCLDTEPFGQDSSLVHMTPGRADEKQESFFAGADTLIRFHQQVISDADGPRSHFIPSSSQYMMNAIKKYGFFEGTAMGLDRLIRENNEPWIYPTRKTRDGHVLKLDPVP